MKLSGLDLAMVVAYAVFIFALAQFVSRRKGGHETNTTDYFLASKSLPWWAIGASLIAANISAEQIVGMAGSGYAIGLAIASYEWMAAATLLIVAKFFLPIFLQHNITTMPQFLEQRFGPRLRAVMAVFWLVLYVFVNLTSIIWLGSIAVTQVAGVDQDYALAGLGVFALLYQLKGGLKAVALTDIVQVALLVTGGLIIAWLTLGKIGGGDVMQGWHQLVARLPDHFHMILKSGDPHYKDLPGLSVIIGGMWIANIAYWGCNQYIIQRGLAAKSLPEAQRGMVMAAFLKLIMPVIIVLPGIAAVMLAPDLAKPDLAYPTMMAMLPPGLLGLVFAALVAAIVASTASKINSIATIFTLDVYAKWFAHGHKGEGHLVRVGRTAACVSILIAIAAARPLLGGLDQAFQYIQEFSGFVTPGITVIFLLGLFWPRASETGALTGAIASVGLSIFFRFSGIEALTAIPFMNRMLIIFALSLLLAVGVSLARPAPAGSNRIDLAAVDFHTTKGFNLSAVLILAILALLYGLWW